MLGGGTGSFVVLTGLKNLPIDLGVIVTMMDSGGSTGRLRDQLGVLPPGDLRQCLVAMSEAPMLWRELFLYRFEQGDLKGHNFGNIFLSALEKVADNYDEVMDLASYVLQIKGKVIPVTFKNTHVCVEYESGKKIVGEGNIDEDNDEKSRVKQAYLEPKVAPNPEAISRLKESDVIIVGPGDMYTSIVPVLLIDSVKDTIKKSAAKIVYNMNLMTKAGQTHNYKASDHLKDITRYLGREPDVMIVNNGEIPKDILEWYRAHDEELVENDLHHTGYKGTIIETDLIDRKEYVKSKADTLARSVLRHDSDKLTGVLTGFAT